MADRPQPQPGVVSLRVPITLRGKSTSTLFAKRWLFQTDEDLGIAPWQGRGPVARAWFAVAAGEPVNDPGEPGTVHAPTLALIPSENVLGFVACDKAPHSDTDLEPEASPA